MITIIYMFQRKEHTKVCFSKEEAHAFIMANSTKIDVVSITGL